MKTERLYFNGQLVELPNGVQISTNYQIATFKNLEDFQISFTNTITIPSTEKFINILRGYGIEGAQTTAPYRINRVTYYRNGVLQFENASAIITSYDQSFKINIYFQNNALFEIIDGLKISDLQLSQFNHQLNLSKYNELLVDGVLSYPLANYGVQEDEEILFEYQVPAIKTSYLWNKIFADNGFSYVYKGRGNRPDFNPFLSEEWNDARLTFDQGIQPNTEEELEEIDFSVSGRAQNQFDFVQSDIPFEVFFGLGFDTQRNDSNMYVNGLNGASVFAVNEENYYKIQLGGDVIAADIQECRLEVLKNGIFFTEIATIEQGVNQFSFDERLFLTDGDELLFQFRCTNQESNQTIDLNCDINIEITVDNQFRNINLSEYFNKIGQKEFIKNLANKFGLVFRQVGTVYEFISFKELLTPFANYQSFDALKPVNFVFDDWSDKFNNLVKQETKLSKNWKKRNSLQYKYINENDNFADSEILIDDQTLENEGTILNSLFFAPRNSNISLPKGRLKRIPLYEVEEEGPKVSKPGAFFITTKKVEGTFKYKQVGANPRTYNGQFQIANFKGLSFVELKNKWIQLQSILTRTEKIEAELKLNELDIQSLNWFKLKYIKQLGGLYYLNKINNFTNNETTVCELTKVRPFEQIGEFNDDFNDDFKT